MPETDDDYLSWLAAHRSLEHANQAFAAVIRLGLPEAQALDFARRVAELQAEEQAARAATRRRGGGPARALTWLRR